MSAVSTSLPNRLSRARLVLGLLLVLALSLRLWGIGWGLPNATRYFSFHPDESVVVGYSLGLNPLLLLVEPGFYNYGSLSLLLNGLFIHLGEWFGLVGPGPSPVVASASALLTARLVTVLLGTATCGFLFGVGRLLFGTRAGLWAAGLYAIAPLAVQHGHFATVDVPSVFWIVGSLYFAARHLSSERRARDLWWAGLWAGLAMATKYNAALIVLSGIVSWWLARPRNGRGLAALVGGLSVGFLVGCPGVFLNFPALYAGVTYEAQHVREGHGLVFAQTPPGLLYHLTFNLPWAMGWPLVVAGLVGVGYGLYRRRPGDWLLLAFALPYYLLIGLAQVKFARYTLPLLPLLALWVGAMVPPAATTPRLKMLFTGIHVALGAAASFAFLLTGAFDSVMTQTDTRDTAAQWIRQKQVPSVGFPSGPWFNAPTLGPSLASFNPSQAKASALEVASPTLIPAQGEWNVDQVTGADAPAVVALSEINQYADAERTADPAAMNYLSVLRHDYPNLQVWANPLTFCGVPFTTLHTQRGDQGILPTQNLPHDMLYTNPTTVLFTR